MTTEIKIYRRTLECTWEARYENQFVARGSTWTRRGAERAANKALKRYCENGVTVS